MSSLGDRVQAKKIRSKKWWKITIKILTIFFVIWVLSFLFSDFVQVHVLAWTQRYGYPVIFLWIVAANILAGLPSSFLPIGIGLAASRGEFQPAISIAIITIASILGDIIAYALSRRFRHTFLSWLGVSEDDPDYQKAYHYIQHGGRRLVFVTRFLFAGILGFVNYAAGMLKMPFWSFFWLALLGEIVWSFLWFGIGYYPLELKPFFLEYWPFSIPLAIALIVGYVFLHRYYKRQNRHILKVVWATLIGKFE